MLDRASIERLSKTPEKNAPMLNVALAEEGPAPVLLALARSAAVGPEALAVIEARIEAEGAEVGRDPEAPDGFASPLGELERLLVAHPRASDDVRDALLARHASDPFFVLAAAAHPRATPAAVARCVAWPAASPVHDRLWIAAIDRGALAPLVAEEWAHDDAELVREAAGRLARDEAVLGRLAADPSRRVRRAVASNRQAGPLRARLASTDPAPEVRARAAGQLGAHDSPDGGASYVDSARFAAALRAMTAGGVLAPDVHRALAAPADLDLEGARLAAMVLPREALFPVVEGILVEGVDEPRALELGAGLALRPTTTDEAGERELADIVYDTVKALAATSTAQARLTGKARLCAWSALGLARHVGAASSSGASTLLAQLGSAPLGADRMLLARAAARCAQLLPALCAAARSQPGALVPAALVELAWRDPAVDTDTLVEIAARVAKPKKRVEALPEDEVDLDPAARPVEALARVALALTARTDVSPRTALAVVALDSRRTRYVLAAMPQWKGRLAGAHLGRVLRHHAGALSAAGAEQRPRVARVESWTERLLSEIELGVALAVGHLTAAEVARRIEIGRQHVDDGLSLVAGADARAALEGSASLAPLVAWAAKHRTQSAAALAAWLLFEKHDRARAPTLVAGALDGFSAAGKTGVPASVCDALAILERRAPGRLEDVHPQSPRGRSTLASAIARAYRAVGGMRDERQE